MKKIIVLLISFGFYGLLPAQKLTLEKYIDLKKSELQAAGRYGDIQVYKNTLYDLIVAEPANKAWKDSLAVLYFQTGSYPQVIALTTELLQSDPGNEKYLRMQGESYEALGDLKKAIEIFEKLAAKHPDDAVLHYRLAWDQYNLKRSEEAYNTLLAIKDAQFPDVKVNMPAGVKKWQAVPLKAAYYNLLGLTAYDLHNLDLAVQYFDQALKEYPDFVSAKQNKAAVELMKAKLAQPADNKDAQKSNKTAQ